MQILSQPAITRNGNLYQRTNKMATTGALLAGGFTAAKEIRNVVLEASSSSKGEKAIQIGAVALITFLSAGLGKLFGSVLDNQTNKNREEQTDRLNAIIANMSEVIPEVESEECDCEECFEAAQTGAECECDACLEEAEEE